MLSWILDDDLSTSKSRHLVGTLFLSRPGGANANR
jgi:hypothetical protein